jgi:hypothetical protein
MGGRGQGLCHAPLLCGQPLAPYCVGSPRPPSGSRSVFGPLPGKIGLLKRVSSNSENISYIAFLNTKIAEKRELALWHLVSRLVPEIA